MIVVVDASVAVEYLLRTELGRSCAPRLDHANLVAPDLLDSEVLSALRHAVGHGRLGVRRAEEALADLVEWPVRRIPSRDLVRDAWRFRQNASGYDSMYLAVAWRFESPLVTADGPLSRAPSMGVLIENVRI